MFCRGAIEVLFNLKAAERLRWQRRGGNKPLKLISFFSLVLWLMGSVIRLLLVANLEAY